MANYAYIRSKLNGNVIDIQQASTKAGAPLDAYLQKPSSNDNQLWQILPDSECWAAHLFAARRDSSTRAP